jgi:hypothetical protein
MPACRVRTGPPISAQASGLVRLLRQRLRTEARKLTAAADRIPEQLIAGVAFKRGIGAERAWGHLLARMPRPPHRMDRDEHIALWRLLRPVDAVMINPADGEDIGDQAIVASWLAIGRGRGRAVRREGPWGASFTNHALGRLLERTGFQADPVAVMLAAHDALLSASTGCARTMVGERLWAIPAGPGAFLTTVRGLTLDGDALVLATAETWVSDDQLWPQQAAQVAAIRFREPGRTLGDGLLQPSVLRPPAVPEAREGGQFARLAV